jgi:hypothetical protein
MPDGAAPVFVLDSGTVGAAARVQLLAAWQRQGGILLCA